MDATNALKFPPNPPSQHTHTHTHHPIHPLPPPKKKIKNYGNEISRENGTKSANHGEMLNVQYTNDIFSWLKGQWEQTVCSYFADAFKGDFLKGL